MSEPSTTIVLHVEFDSRWRVGTGTARAGVADSETWKDARGHVTIPGSHLKRKLRQHAELVAGLLGHAPCGGRLNAAADPEQPGGEGQPGVTCIELDTSTPCLPCRVFGQPRLEPAWHFGPGALDLPGLDAGEERVVLGAERSVAAHNRVDPWSRRVAEDLLFQLEAGRPGLAFTATITHLDGTAPDSEVALLAGAAGALESLGGRTRRGYGRCRAWVDPVRGRSHDQWVNHLLDAVPPWHRPAGTPATHLPGTEAP